MKSVVRWAIRNSPAMNTLMISVLVVGLVSIFSLRREVFPEFELEIILVSVPYPGASPEEVETGICQKIEEAVFAIDGIKKQTAVAKEGLGSVVLELETGVDAQKILNEVRSEVDRIPSFPLLAEDPEVKQITMRQPAIEVGIIGPQSDSRDSELKLRAVAEMVRDDLIRREDISQADIVGAKAFQIDIEISEKTLRRYGLTLQKVAEIVRQENMELPGGTVKTKAQSVLIKGNNKKVLGEEIAKIPLVTQEDGVVLTVGDLGKVRDEFIDVPNFTRINGKPGIVIAVTRTSKEDLLAVAASVRDYVNTKNLPPGYQMEYWSDRSVDVRDRMNLLSKNGFQGLLLVLLVLALFLETRLAWWVAIGIPIAILGACAILLYAGQTLNMLTMFAFLMALGIVVDDAIVVGENIYHHRSRGVGFIRAAIDGTLEVLPSVTTSVTTTIIAFMPLFFVTGVMGKFIAVLPLAMISMLVISLLECMTLLPCHLGHGREENHQPETLTQRALRFRRRLPPILAGAIGWLVVALAFVLSQFLYPFRRLEDLLTWISQKFNRGLELVARKGYAPSLLFSIRSPLVALSIALFLLILSATLIRGGVVPFVIFPKLDSNTIEARINFPDGTRSTVTDQATQQLVETVKKIDAKYRQKDMPIVTLTRRSVGFATTQQVGGMRSEDSGGHIGVVQVELVDTAERNITSQQILGEWRELFGSYPGMESIKFKSSMHGPGGNAIEFRLLAKPEDFETLKEAVKASKEKLKTYRGVFDISDDAQPGKWEYQLSIKESAKSLNVKLADVAETVRASIYGAEVMRLQRGRHEVKLMVRYPPEERDQLQSLKQIRVRLSDGAERPLYELVDIKKRRSLKEINRVDQLRSITITADVDEAQANARQIVQDLQANFIPTVLKEEFPEVSVRWEGQQQQTVESMESLMVGFVIAIIIMFVVLTVEFRSYFQPILILAIIPFGIVGAVFGHAILGLPFTMFSVFGLVALTGVVVNDSIVLIDFINHRVRDDGMPLNEALLHAGQRRLRPVVLTSVTTIAGLLPLLLERSFQAQVLIPMAVSLCFGLMMTTLLVLYLVPTFYSMYARLFMAEVEEEVLAGEDALPEGEARPRLVAVSSGNGVNQSVEHQEAIADAIPK